MKKVLYTHWLFSSWSPPIRADQLIKTFGDNIYMNINPFTSFDVLKLFYQCSTGRQILNSISHQQARGDVRFNGTNKQWFVLKTIKDEKDKNVVYVTNFISNYVTNVTKMSQGPSVSLQSRLFEPHTSWAYVTGLLGACRINSFKTSVVHLELYPESKAGRERVKKRFSSLIANLILTDIDF